MVPGRDDAIADGVAGGVELAVGELRRDIGAAVSGNRDADIGSLVFDFADRACDGWAADGFARSLQLEPVLANRERVAADRDDVMAADEFCGEFGARVIEDFARR